MQRRSFLTAAAAGLAATVAGPSGVAFAAPAPGSGSGSSTAKRATPAGPSGAAAGPGVLHDGRHYRGTADGKVLVTADQGASWHVHSNFGPSVAVSGLATDAGRLVATLHTASRGFALTLAGDAKTWHTAGTTVARTPLR